MGRAKAGGSRVKAVEVDDLREKKLGIDGEITKYLCSSNSDACLGFQLFEQTSSENSLSLVAVPEVTCRRVKAKRYSN